LIWLFSERYFELLNKILNDKEKPLRDFKTLRSKIQMERLPQKTIRKTILQTDQDDSIIKCQEHFVKAFKKR